ncbi:MAG: site-specific integrase, partial [SAR202 cluster bacterium]|nr:site-specific integrase [SAR202 cluster bacterium]
MPPPRKLTKKGIDSLDIPNKAPALIRDTTLRGFGIKVTTTGKRVFFAEALIKGGKTKRITVGPYPTIELEEAREIARKNLLTMSQGGDPIAVAQEQRAKREREAAKDEALSKTLQFVFDQYRLAHHHTPKTQRDCLSTMRVCFSDWLDQPVRTITRQMVEQRFYDIRDTRGKAQAAKAMRYLSAVLNHAKAEEIDGERLLNENPCEVLKDKKVDRRIKPRERYLDKDELGRLLEELDHFHHPEYIKQAKRITNETVADFLWLLIFTGLRRDEAATLEWDHVKFQDRYFYIEDTKNGDTHYVPMSTPVELMLRRRYSYDTRHEIWVFPANRGDGHLVEPKKQIKIASEIIGFRFSCHDLRRTFATLAESHGIDFQSIKRALNHKSQDITSMYIQRRVERQRETFDAIAEEVHIW